MAQGAHMRAIRKRKFVSRSGAELGLTELGFGAAPLGNLYRPLTEKEARATLDAAWAEGIRYYDTAPLYGLGLSETRLNGFLRAKPRDSYFVSTKIGRLLQLCPPAEKTRADAFFETPSRREVFDYSYDGVMRSLEFSLERLGSITSTSSMRTTSTSLRTAARRRRTRASANSWKAATRRWPSCAKTA